MAKFCVNCGDKLNEDSKFCPSCGSNVGVDTDNQQPQMSASEATYNSHAVSGGKSKMAAGLLGIFLGGWGIHNFYLGYTGKGILQIVLTMVTCGAAALWGFIEGILILCGSINTDANGNRLID